MDECDQSWVDGGPMEKYCRYGGQGGVAGDVEVINKDRGISSLYGPPPAQLQLEK
jgi:hypothetical protein